MKHVSAFRNYLLEYAAIMERLESDLADAPAELQEEVDRVLAQLPETEIEITEAMIAAGVSELIYYDPAYESHAGAVERIYRAMVRAVDD